MASRRLRKKREDPVTKLAKTILPAEQIAHGGLVIRDISNHSEDEQRRMTRTLAWDEHGKVKSGERKTIRKLSRVELMTKAGVINPDQAAACTWYAAAHELGFQTVGCTTNYGEGGGGFGWTDLLARYKAQSEARKDYYFARSAIPSHLVGIFESIVLGTGRPPHMMPKADKLRFSLAAFLLHQQIGHMLMIAA